jgi:hypothetical protein
MFPNDLVIYSQLHGIIFRPLDNRFVKALANLFALPHQSFVKIRPPALKYRLLYVLLKFG